MIEKMTRKKALKKKKEKTFLKLISTRSHAKREQTGSESSSMAPPQCTKNNFNRITGAPRDSSVTRTRTVTHVPTELCSRH